LSIREGISVKRTAIVTSVIAVGLLLPSLAEATHRHVRVLANGSCVIVAKQGNEPFVTLPEASFKNTSEPTTTANPHPLHVHVHRGQPGEAGTIAVLGSADDPCATTGNYVNAP
jgi:hypothetical protein